MIQNPVALTDTQAALEEKSELERRIEKSRETINTLTRQIENVREKVASDNRDSVAMEGLNRLEQQLAEEKKILQNLEKRNKELANAIRSMTLKMEHTRVDELKAKLKTLKKRKEELHKIIIPKQELKLSNLKEEYKQIEEQIEQLTHDLHEIPQ